MFYQTQTASRPPKRPKMPVFCPWWPWPLTLTFKLVRVRDQTRLPREFVANPFSSSRDISYTNKKLEQRCFSKHKPHAGRWNHPWQQQNGPAAAEWRYMHKRVPFCRFRGWWECTARFVPGDLDLDIQTRPSKGPNTSFVWLWRKSVQRFRRYLIHKQKINKKTALKTEPYAVHCVR